MSLPQNSHRNKRRGVEADYVQGKGGGELVKQIPAVLKYITKR